MNTRRTLNENSLIPAIACLLFWPLTGAFGLEAAQTDAAAARKAAPASAPAAPELAQVIKLAESGVDEEVVLAYIRSARIPKPSADDVIYLHQAGLSKRVILAVVSKTEPSPAPKRPSIATPSAAPSI